MRNIYKIEVECANCANKMEIAASKVSGIKEVSVNFMALKMLIDFEDGVDQAAVMSDVLKACRRIERNCEIYF